MKKISVLFLFFLFSFQGVQAQISAGVYQNAQTTQIGIGSNPEKQLFGELRLLAGDVYNRYFGAEIIGQYTIRKSENYNLSGGIMVGLDDFENGKVGIPILLSLKPFENVRNFAFVLEATPYYMPELLYFRGNIGIRYTFGSN
ncbi:hypothetical protein [Pleomorphovibrio marinus]|uniref:hypothetical protein n=1 Tax=Pleomorphovibrio marinus TaxID=2164132 RepID=UPI000E0B4C42|nr:hypothetical protein [Pleomorphovibrio marinus]